MDDVQERLLILLDYWIEHNSEHEHEFRDWAAKVVLLSGEVAWNLQEAVIRMGEVNDYLMKARESLAKGEEKC